jgi:hypothetical protein
MVDGMTSHTFSAEWGNLLDNGNGEDETLGVEHRTGITVDTTTAFGKVLHPLARDSTADTTTEFDKVLRLQGDEGVCGQRNGGGSHHWP